MNFLKWFILTVFLVICVSAFGQDLNPSELPIFAFLQGLAQKYAVAMYILSGLGSLVCVGLAYVAITPSKQDDNFVAKLEAMPLVGMLLRILRAFSPIQKK